MTQCFGPARFTFPITSSGAAVSLGGPWTVYVAGGPRAVNLYLADSAGCRRSPCRGMAAILSAIGIRSLSQGTSRSIGNREIFLLPGPDP